MEEQFANHSEQVVETPEVQTESQQQETVESTPQDNYFTVKYNKEERQVSYDEAPDYIQKGMNYDKVQQRASEYENRMKELAELSGFQSTDELFNAIEEQKKAAERQRYEQAGIDPDTFNSLLENHPDVQFAREMKAKQEQDAKLQQEWTELSQEFPDLDPKDIPQEVWALNEQGKPLLDAYLRHNYRNLGQQKEQEALKKLQQNQTSSTGSLSQGEVQHNTSVKNMSKAEFESYVRKVKNGEVRNL